MPEINHLVGIRGSLDEIYAAISTVEGLQNWWTADTSGSSELGGIIRFRFGSYGGSDMKVTELRRNAVVRWLCLAHPDEWVGTEFTFALLERDGEVKVRFTQTKWREVTDILAFCSTKWAVYLLSLKEYIETGGGRPHPHDLQTTHR